MTDQPKVIRIGESTLRKFTEFPGKAEWEASQRAALKELLADQALIRVDYPKGYVPEAAGPRLVRPQVPNMPLLLATAFFATPISTPLQVNVRQWTGNSSFLDGLVSMARQGVINGFMEPINRAISFRDLKDRVPFSSLLGDPRELRVLIVTGCVLSHDGADWYPMIDRALGDSDRVGPDRETRENSGHFVYFERADRLQSYIKKTPKGAGVLFGSLSASEKR